MEERVITEARRAVEAVVMAAIEPVEPQVLAQLVEIPVTEVEALCTELAEEYEREARGFTLVRVAGGYRYQTHPDMAAYVERFVLEGQTARLSGPALETLAIIAYKQPIARAQISAIRGVNVDATLKTLVARGYVEESGHETTPGNPSLFSTTRAFLERLGVDSLADLPPLADFVPESSLVEALERGLRGTDEQLDAESDAEIDVEARAAIEAVILSATEPVPPALLAQLVEVPTTRVEELCEELAAEYANEGRGFQLARVAGGYRFQTHPDAYAYVERFVLEGQTARLSGPALETLAIIAYKQPIARAQISAIRGVNVDATLKTLVARGYVEESGHEHTPGNPTLFSTTQAFLERLGVDSLADLPALADFVPESSLVEALERGLRGVDVELDEQPGETPEQ